MGPRAQMWEQRSESSWVNPQAQLLLQEGPWPTLRALTHLSARPRLVRPEMTMGSKGSSVPEMVMPRGPP